ncbi:substrate-binding periplasmic protein [Pseudoalteromonas sp.]|uniref:substrate-binding periplasmic protein n=1 Tax=Pseudoalteromonas sp. TaxID=53249 RepID=UPI00356740D3
MKSKYGLWLFIVVFYKPFVLLGFETDEITIFTEHFPPYNYILKNDIVGINHDIVARACHLAEIKCVFKLYPWQRAMALTKSKRFAGLISTSRLAEREEFFHWVGPLISSPACLYQLVDRTDIHIFNHQQLKNYTVGLQKGDVYEHLLKSWGLEENKHYINYSEKFGEINAFKLGKLDLFIASANTLQFHIDNNRLKKNEVKPAYYINDEKLLGNYLALNNDMPIEIVKKLQQGIDMMRLSGEITEIKKQYLPRAKSDISEQEFVLEKRCLY